MFDAQLLSPVSGTTDTTVFSPWFPRGGDKLLATLEVVAVSGATVKVELFTKNSEDPDDGDPADTGGSPVNITRSSAGRTTQEWSDEEASTIGIEELVRYKYTVSGSASSDWVLFRMLPPVWFDAAQA